MEKRKEKRYLISESQKERFNKNIYIEIFQDDSIRANLADININGLGFEIESVKTMDIDRLDERDDLYIKIHFKDIVLLVEGKKKWSALLEGDGDYDRVYKCGIKFESMSSNDRLTLVKIIEKIRSL